MLPGWVAADPAFVHHVETHVARIAAQLPETVSAFEKLEHTKMAFLHMGRDIERASKAPPLALQPAWQAPWLLRVLHHWAGMLASPGGGGAGAWGHGALRLALRPDARIRS